MGMDLNNPAKLQRITVAYMLFLFAILSISAASARTAEAKFDIVIGSICIGELPTSARKIVRSIQHGADVFEDWEVNWRSRPKSARPLIKFLRKATITEPSTSCREMEGDILLTGDLESIRLQARSSAPGNVTPPRMIIPPGGLDLKIGHVRSGLASLFGGTLNLAGSKAWIANRDKLVVVEGSPTLGKLEITSWARTIQNANLSLRSGSPMQMLDLSANNENITISAPLDGSDTELVAGRLVGHPVTTALPVFELPTTDLRDTQVEIGKLVLERRGVEARLQLEKISIKFQSATVKSPGAITKISDGSATIEKIASQIPPSADLIAVITPSISAMKFDARVCETELVTKPFVSSERCHISIAKADSTFRNYVIESDKISSVGFSHIFGATETSTLSTRIDGTNEIDTLSGDLTKFDLRTGSLKLHPVSNLKFKQVALTGPSSIRIPIDINVPKASGAITHELPDGRLMLEGRLDALRLQASLVLSPQIDDPWRLEVSKGKFSFIVSGLAAFEPLLFGGTTQFAGLAIAFENQTDLIVAKSTRQGRVIFTPDVTTVLDPRLSLGRSPEGIVFKAPAMFDARSSLSLDIATGGIDVESGKLVIEQAAAIVEAGRPATIGDIKVENGSIRFAKLSALFANGIGAAELIGLEAAIEQISTIPSAEGGRAADQVSWSGRAHELLRSELITAKVERDVANTKRMKLTHVSIKNTCIAIKDATIGSASAFVASGESLRACIKEWSDEALRADLLFKNGHVVASDDDVAARMHVPLIEIAITSGTPQKPGGTGRIVTTSLDANANTPVEVKQSCISEPDFMAVKAKTHVQAAAAQLNIFLQDGVIKGGGNVLFAQAKLRSTETYDCRTELINWKLWSAVKAKTDVPCPTWSNPFRWCLKEITIIPEGRVTIDSRLKVYQLAADLNAIDPRLVLSQSDDGKTELKVCAGNLIQATPIIAASYVFQPRTPIPGFDRFIGDLMGVVAAPFESSLLTALANLFTSGVSVLRIFGKAPFCG